MEYTIYFRIFDKKMKCKITAQDEKGAEYLLRGKIQIDKIEVDKISDDNVV